MTAGTQPVRAILHLPGKSLNLITMRTLLTVLILNSILILTSCQKEPGPEYTPPLDFQENKKAAGLIAADNAFAFELLNEVDEFTDKVNYMISPLSVSIALGMTMNGAEGQTEDAFVETLGFGGMDPSDINYIHGALIAHLQKVDPKVTMEVANSIWVNQLYTLLKEFADTNRHYYNAEIRNLEFINPGGVNIINQWVEEKTHGKIKNVLDYIPADAVMYLINALYFYGNWKFEFEEDPGFRINFNNADGTMEMTPAMTLKSDLEIMTNSSLTAVDLPYGNDKFSMVLLLPAVDKSTDDLIAEMDIETWNEWMDDFYTAGVRLEMPKFKHDYKVLLNQPLSDMGLDIAFSGSAEFPDMLEGTSNLAISRVIHQTFIDVNEKGTEAAAVTVVEMELTSVGGGGSTRLIRFDRPFLYVIREKTSNAIVFMGKVGNPEGAE